MLVVNFRTVRVTIDPFSSRCCNGPGGGSSSSSTSVLAAAAVDRSFSTEIEPGCSRSMADARVRCLEKTLSSSRKGHSQCNHLCLLVLFFLLLLRKTGFWYTRLSRGPCLCLPACVSASRARTDRYSQIFRTQVLATDNENKCFYGPNPV